MLLIIAAESESTAGAGALATKRGRGSEHGLHATARLTILTPSNCEPGSPARTGPGIAKANVMSCRPAFARAIQIALVMTLALAVLAPRQLSARQHRRAGIHKSAPVVPFSTVVIDAGHGGGDPGGIRQNIIPEKNVALDVAQRVQKALRKAGLRTVMTRNDDRFIPLDTRVAIANSYGDAIFLCIHFNSAVRRDARGVETYYAAPTEAALAARIQRNLAATTSGRNRGVKRAAFRVLRNTQMRAVLAECGFLTNPQDVALASNPRYRQTLALQISRAIIDEQQALRPLAQTSR